MNGNFFIDEFPATVVKYKNFRSTHYSTFIHQNLKISRTKYALQPIKWMNLLTIFC